MSIRYELVHLMSSIQQLATSTNFLLSSLTLNLKSQHTTSQASPPVQFPLHLRLPLHCLVPIPPNPHLPFRLRPLTDGLRKDQTLKMKRHTHCLPCKTGRTDVSLLSPTTWPRIQSLGTVHLSRSARSCPTVHRTKSSASPYLTPSALLRGWKCSTRGPIVQQFDCLGYCIWLWTKIVTATSVAGG